MYCATVGSSPLIVGNTEMDGIRTGPMVHLVVFAVHQAEGFDAYTLPPTEPPEMLAGPADTLTLPETVPLDIVKPFLASASTSIRQVFDSEMLPCGAMTEPRKCSLLVQLKSPLV